MTASDSGIKIEIDDTSEFHFNADDDDIEAALRHSSPFYVHFHKVLQKVVPQLKCNGSVNLEENRFYNQTFLGYIMEYYMPFFPLWSAAIISNYGLLRDSNQPVENWFKTIKYLVFSMKSRIQVARFVQALEDNIEPRLRERKFLLRTERQRQNKRKRDLSPTTTREKVAPKEDEENSETISKCKKPKKKRIPWDLTSEKWDRTKRYFVMPKRVDEAKEMYLDELVLSQSTLAVSREDSCIIKNNAMSSAGQIAPVTGNECRTTPLAVDTIVAASAMDALRNVSSYPPGFPDLHINLFNNILDKHEWMSLLPNHEISDGIVNSFMRLLQHSFQNLNIKILYFDTFLSEQILVTGRAQRGYNKWAQKVKVWTYPIWLIPVNSANNTHWSLLVINFSHECMVYLDSLHLQPDVRLIEGYMNFAELHCKGRRKPDYYEWTLYIPDDIPHQNRGNGTTTNNCGVHMMTWAYIATTSSFCDFNETNMDNIRKGIAQLLYNARNTVEKHNKKLEKLQKDMLDVVEEEAGKKKSARMRQMHTTNEIPMDSHSTLEYFASLIPLMCEEHGHYTRSQTA